MSILPTVLISTFQKLKIFLYKILKRFWFDEYFNFDESETEINSININIQDSFILKLS